MSTQNERNPEQTTRDNQTIDVFTQLSEDEINNIAMKLLSSSKIQKRFGNRATIEYVHDFIVKLLNTNPETLDTLSRWKNYKHKQKAA